MDDLNNKLKRKRGDEQAPWQGVVIENQKNIELRLEINNSDPIDMTPLILRSAFEDVVFYLQQGALLDDIEHPNNEKYPNQRVFVINIDDYAYLVPYVEDRKEIFLKTVIPSRKATKQYLGELS